MLNPDDLTKRLINSKAATIEEILGCNEQEINQVCEVNCLTLPEAYLGFLRAVGKGAGRFMCEVDGVGRLFPGMWR